MQDLRCRAALGWTAEGRLSLGAFMRRMLPVFARRENTWSLECVVNRELADRSASLLRKRNESQKVVRDCCTRSRFAGL